MPKKRIARLNKKQLDLFYYFLGALEGDGHLKASDGLIKINVTDKDFINEIQYALEESLGLQVKQKILKAANKNCKNQYCIRLNCIDFFKKQYHLIRPITEKEKANYLRGLYDAEGSVGVYRRKGFKKWLYLSQKDIKKLDEWSGYLSDLGIRSYKHYKKDTRSYIEIRETESLMKFYRTIGFSINRKMENLRKILQEKNRIDKRKEDVSIRDFKIKEIYGQTNFGKKYLARMFNMTESEITQVIRKFGFKNQSKNKITNQDIEFAEKFIGNKLGFKLDERRRLRYNLKGINLETSKIESIEFYKKEKGVDLLTPKQENFFLDNNILSHNSTLALQIAYYIAWIMSGGKMVWERDDKGKIKVVGMYPPTKPVNFGLNNIVFDPDSLMKKASELPRNSVIVYDEGRAGLDSARAMESINKAMQDFFQECGFYGHIIIIVLPNFFKLHEDYAVARSIFLVDAFHDKEFKRGYFNFYNDRRKENLYFFGKKRIGVSAKYAATDSNFYGRFGEFLPVDKVEYEKLKKEAILKKQMTRFQAKFKMQRDAAIYLAKKYSKMTYEELAQELTVVSGASCNSAMIQDAITTILRKETREEPTETDTKSDDEDADNDVDFKPEIVPDPIFDDKNIIEEENVEEKPPIDFKEAFKDLQTDES